jgi:hypothetical protein
VSETALFFELGVDNCVKDAILYVQLSKRANTMKNVITGIVLTSALAIAAYAGNAALSMPDAHFSYATNECVKVVNYTDEVFACETLPAKFNHVWVK